MPLSGGCDPQQLSPAALAFVGDAVYGLMVRESLAAGPAGRVGALHGASVRLVNAAAQAKAAQMILPILTKQEQDIFRRGRNAHTPHTPRSASKADYHAATGLEALFGYLYLKDEIGRLQFLFRMISGTDAGNTKP